MLALGGLCQRLILEQEQIVQDYNLATARDPWTRVPEAERINFLRDLIRPFVRLALSSDWDSKPSLCQRTLLIAALHGEHRRGQGFEEEVLLSDFDELGKAILRRIVNTIPHAIDPDAFARIEGLLSLAYLASLHGYHRRAYEAQGQWPVTLEKLCGNPSWYHH